MFRFASPEYLFLLILVPILIGVFIYSGIRRKRNIKKLGNPELLEGLMPNVSRIRPHVKFYIQLLALVLIIVVLAQPQFGSKEETVKRQGIEVMIALDVSNSMLAEDIKPNRLEKAKQMVSQLVDNMENDKIGLIVFAGDAFVQLPITVDYVSAKMFMSTINTQIVSRQGTAIGTAIDLAIKSFGQPNESGRSIIVITDGENHEDDAIGAAKLAAESGIAVNVIGMGRPEGSPIPIPGTMSFRKDRNDNVVVSRLNEEMCREIAKAGKGTYVRADNTNTAVRAIGSELDKLAKSEIESKVFTTHNEQYQSFAFFALFLLIADFFIFYRKNKKLSKIKIFDLKDKISK
ncbi:VWA domain-containing protein [Paludibacter sp. 221]|uniref:vWA domain-containing protein n=1 Tax=Paludibacter sp. 221 TaxID=2302939 RepID=UPI0013D2D708|nr:VWA domain-containing protein [Paludibacter sp. 221]NDV47660.1 VWA domain-containing protein [Paludibacter sp. 221]